MVNSIKPLVAIVGRPNVGKSTLFNRLTNRGMAIVSDVPGTTRDRISTETYWGDQVFILVDTGGLNVLPGDKLSQLIESQINVAISDADILVMLVDSSTGIMSLDLEVAEKLRKTEKPVILAVNKSDNETREHAIYEFFELGLGEPISISAYHNKGIDDLMTTVISNFPSNNALAEHKADINLAIVGRVNVGKSSLINTLCGQDRSIVSDIPGTTRDAIDTLINFENKSILAIDTAGLRRKGSIEPGVEKYSTLRTIRALDRADIAILMTDASELATAQDAHIAGYVTDAHKGIVIAVNKWDMSQELDIDKQNAERLTKTRFKFMPFAPLCFISALNHNGIDSLLRTVQSVHVQWNKTLPRYDLRRTVLDAVAQNPPATTGRNKLKVYGVTQDQTAPPSFTFYVNKSDMLHFSYRRYLENSLRSKYGFEGSPLRMRFKGRGEE